MVQRGHRQISLRRQCQLIWVNRSKLDYEGAQESAQNLDLMKRIDQIYLDQPVYGYRRMTQVLRRQSIPVNAKRVRRLMRLMGLEAVYPKARTSLPAPGHKKYPYLLKGRRPSAPNQIWCMDITYVPMRLGFMYLMAIMDWWSRYVIVWDVSNTMEAESCAATLQRGLEASGSRPHIFNTDQGSQFTSEDFTGLLEAAGVQVSMDGRGRALDNVFIERLWRSVKYEDIYLREYGRGDELQAGLLKWFDHYNQDRPHQALGYATPWEYHHQSERYGASPASWWQDGRLVS